MSNKFKFEESDIYIKGEFYIGLGLRLQNPTITIRDLSDYCYQYGCEPLFQLIPKAPDEEIESI